MHRYLDIESEFKYIIIIFFTLSDIFFKRSMSKNK